MTRKIKNVLMILILLISLGGLIFGIVKIQNDINDNLKQMNFSETHLDYENPPEKPNDEELILKDENPPEKPDADESNLKEENLNRKVNMDLLDYLVLGIFSLVFSLDLLYLIFSKFNKLSSNEVFSSLTKIIIFILCLIVLTGLFTYVSSLMINKSSPKLSTNESRHEDKIVYAGNTLINTETTEDQKEYSSTKANENAILVSGPLEAHINNSNLTKTGDSNSGDNTSFYGINSGILVKEKAKLYVDNMTVNTDCNGGNGVFSYGDGITTITNSRIKTSKDNSGGIMVAGGGTINAINLDIETSGTSSAAIRSDRGGGVIDVNLGNYKTFGSGSPAIYSTANINVSESTLSSAVSEGVIIEGGNSISLNKVTLVDTNNKLHGKSTTYKNIFIYQSMSGDAKEGTATFKAVDSNVTTNKGDTIYVTNTKANIEFTNTTFVNNDETGYFLRIQKDSWGKEGANGGDVNLTLNKEKITGNIFVDSLSTLSISLANSTLETMINKEAKSVSLNIDKMSKFKLTGDTYVTTLTDEDPTYENIDLNGFKLFVNNKELKKDA